MSTTLPARASASAEAFVGGVRTPLDDPQATIETAVAGVVAAQPGLRELSSADRAAILDRIVAMLSEDVESLADELADEARFLTRNDMVLEVQRAIDVCTLTAAAVREGFDRVVNLAGSARGRDTLAVVKRVPIGPMLAITAFNGPMLIAAHKLAPAIATGTAAVLKPSPRVPRAGVAFAERIVAAGWPAEALAVLPVGNEETMALVTDPRLPVISFTGGDIGWAIKDAAPRKHVHLELGGVGAVLVAADADLDEVAEQCVIGGFVRSGQACLGVQRIYAHADVYEPLVERLRARVGALSFADPAQPDTNVGPLVDERSAERVQGLIDDAVGKGAELSCGAPRADALIAPTLLSETSAEMAIMRNEAFGPVIAVARITSMDEGLREANAAGGALNAGVFTQDIDLALALADDLDAGSVIINGSNAWRIDTMPFGGTGTSGFGREGVHAMVNELTTTKTVVIRRRKPDSGA
jgi:acyl-CoA reductase-like NAD-dependent aldehyde dehydrogenase